MERDVQKHRYEGEGERRRGEETQVRGKRQGGGRERWGRTERQKQGGKDVEVSEAQTDKRMESQREKWEREKGIRGRKNRQVEGER